MHGIIHTELKRYVTTKLGAEQWTKLLAAAGLSDKIYVVGGSYPDAELVALVTAGAQATKLPADALLEDFGDFIVPTLLETYRPYIDKRWRTLDLLENTENTIHRVVRQRNPGAAPPHLKVTRPSKNEVVITYASPRKLCAVAKGITRGVAKHYGERIEITELGCMNAGAAVCEIRVRLLN